jgi:heptosyltransferase-2
VPNASSGLVAAGWSSLILVGGAGEASLANDITTRLGAQARHVLPALGWNLAELAALFAGSAFYVGNDTGVMNLAAAVGTRTYCLFGATPPFHHSRSIVAVTPPGGIDPQQGMRRITAEAVLATIAADAVRAKPQAAAG